MRTKVLLLAAAATLSACATSPARSPAISAAPPAMAASAAPAFAATQPPAGPYAGVDWSRDFADPGLVAVVEEALARNTDLAAAAARLDQAEARARRSRAQRQASVDVSGSASTTRSAETAPGGADTTSSLGLTIDAAWEADLWGRLRDQTNAAQAAAAAAAADVAAARLSIAARTAESWVDLAEARRLAALSADETARREASQRIVERRYAAGLVEATDVRLARSTSANARATAEARSRSIDDAARRLEILLGRYPAATAGRQAAIPAPQPLPAVGAPGDLLLRRPDIAAAERRLAAAGFQVEAARKASLPSLRLSGSLTSGGSDLADAFDPQTIVSRLVAGLAAPLFRGGALAADRAEADAAQREAAAVYASTLLTAWREAEDALAADAEFARREVFVADALAQTRKAEERVQQRYAEGLASIFNLLDAQSRRIDAESQLIALQADRARARIRLHLALGGGFVVPSLPVSSSTPAG